MNIDDILPIKLDELADEAEQQMHDEERRAGWALVGFFLCVVAGGWLDEDSEVTEPFAIPACEQCLMAGPVGYARRDAHVIVHWRNPGETWK